MWPTLVRHKCFVVAAAAAADTCFVVEFGDYRGQSFGQEAVMYCLVRQVWSTMGCVV
jgi:hypothetical protein